MGVDLKDIEKNSVPGDKKRGRCSACPRQKENKVLTVGAECNSFVCGAHSNKITEYICIRCENEENDDSD